MAFSRGRIYLLLVGNGSLSMASAVMMPMTVLSSDIQALHFSRIFVKRDGQIILKCLNTTSSGFNFNHNDLFKRQWPSTFHSPQKRNSRFLFKPLASSGLETSIADPKECSITLKNAKIVVESQDKNAMQVRVDLAGDENLARSVPPIPGFRRQKGGAEEMSVSSFEFEDFSVPNATIIDRGRALKISVEVSGVKTRAVFDKIFEGMVAAAQPIPGFRRVKGGKTPNIPKDILLEILGPSRVYEKVIKKVINSTVAAYVEKRGLKVRKELRIEQSFEDLEACFELDEEFCFDAVIQLQDAV